MIFYNSCIIVSIEMIKKFILLCITSILFISISSSLYSKEPKLIDLEQNLLEFVENINLSNKNSSEKEYLIDQIILRYLFIEHCRIEFPTTIALRKSQNYIYDILDTVVQKANLWNLDINNRITLIMLKVNPEFLKISRFTKTDLCKKNILSNISLDNEISN